LPKARIRFRSWPEFAKFLTQDTDDRGLFVRLGRPPEIGTELVVEFLFPDLSDLTLRVRVVHRVTAEQAEQCGEEPGMGVQFTDMSAEQAAELQGLIAQADVAKGIVEAEGRSLKPPPSGLESLRAAPRGKPTEPSESAWNDKRMRDAYALLDRSRFDAAERLVSELMTQRTDQEVKVLLLLIQARRATSQFDFEGALEKYGAVLEEQPEHGEAQEQVRQLHGELKHSAELFERVFGSAR
jgi:hypothetical protein